MAISSVYDGSTLIALIIKNNYQPEGIQFVTPENLSQQVGFMTRPKGYVIAPHSHAVVPRNVETLSEVLIVKSGLVRCDLFSVCGEFMEACFLAAGDVIILNQGGHSFEFLEHSSLIEVKQGPFRPDDEKIFL